MYKIMLYFLIFFLYSILGYIVEIIFCSLNARKIVFNRGFLLGPYLPIYGVSCCVMVLLLNKYVGDIFALFIMSAFICTFIEYFTSFILEKIFKVRWWDYTKNKFNINGRVCLENSLLFGLSGVLLIYFIHPLVLDFLYLFPNIIFAIIFWICLIIFVSDLIITIHTMFKLKINETKFEDKDATGEIRLKVRNALSKNTFFMHRLLNAFPNIEIINRKEITEFKNYLENLKAERIKLKKNKRRKK